MTFNKLNGIYLNRLNAQIFKHIDILHLYENLKMSNYFMTVKRTKSENHFYHNNRKLKSSFLNQSTKNKLIDLNGVSRKGRQFQYCFSITFMLVYILICLTSQSIIHMTRILQHIMNYSYIRCLRHEILSFL